MLSFDLSAIDIVLLVAVLILFSLYVSRKPGAPRTEASESRYDSDTERKHVTSITPKDDLNTQEFRTPLSSQPNAESHNCPHSFGYLKDLPRNTPVPDECFGCPQVMKCLFPYE